MADRSPVSEDAPYQVMPGLTVEEFEGLKESIRLNGLLVPIEYDGHGAVLDGHHRLRALRELGREQSHSRVIRSGLSEADKVAHALALNVHRRHLTGDQRADAVHRLRHAGWSIRRIADETGVSKTTVTRDLAQPSQVGGDLPETVTGADGKAYRARRSAKPTTVYVHSAHQQRVAEAALDALGGEVPAKAMDLRRLERMRRAKASQERRDALRATPPAAAGPDIRCTDIGDLDVAPASVDLLLTDPPYLQAHFDPGGPWDVLGRQAAQWLKPGGLLLAYCATSHLARAMSVLSRYEDDGLSYWWTYAVVFKGGNARQVRTRNVASSWRAVLGFRMEGGSALPGFVADPITGGGREKDDHEWQQGVQEARVFIDRLCPPGDQSVVLDPFSGSGTVAVAAALEGRRVIAADIDPDCAAITAHRVSEALATVDGGSSALGLPSAGSRVRKVSDGVQ